MKNNIRDMREGMALTQQQLADATGVSRQTIYAAETGKYVPSVLLALKLAKALDSQVEDIFMLEKED